MIHRQPAVGVFGRPFVRVGFALGPNASNSEWRSEKMVSMSFAAKACSGRSYRSRMPRSAEPEVEAQAGKEESREDGMQAHAHWTAAAGRS
jgi:hypothetical protein